MPEPRIPEPPEDRHARLTAAAAHAWRLRVAGMPVAQIRGQLIAEGFGHLSRHRISKLIESHQEQWIASNHRSAAHSRALQLARLEALYRRALAAFDASTRPIQTRRSRHVVKPLPAEAPGETPDPDRPPAEPNTEITAIHNSDESRSRHGDPSLLEAARAILADINKLLGLHQPQHQHSLYADDVPFDLAVAHIPLEALKALACLQPPATQHPDTTTPNQPTIEINGRSFNPFDDNPYDPKPDSKTGRPPQRPDAFYHP